MPTRIVLFILALCALGPFNAKAQSTPFPYDTSDGLQEGVLLGTGILTSGLGIFLEKKVPTLTLTDINKLSIDRLPRFDHYPTRVYSKKAHQFSNMTGLASIAYPAVALWDQWGEGNEGKILLIGLEGALLNVGLMNITKMLTRRPRPYVYNDAISLELKTDKNSRYSFFSGHTSTSAYFTFMGAQMFNDINPDSNKKGLVWSTAAVLPLLTAYGRVRAGKHFPSDVVVGYCVGAALGILIPKLHKI